MHRNPVEMLVDCSEKPDHLNRGILAQQMQRPGTILAAAPCQQRSVAPENRLIAPTGAKSGACGMRRSNPPITVKLSADDDLDGVFITVNPLSLYQMPPGSVPTELPELEAGGSPSGSRRRTRR